MFRGPVWARRSQSPLLLIVRVSVIIPVYNERSTVMPTVQAVLAVREADEIVIVDDGSTDGTRELYPAISELDESIRVILHDTNLARARPFEPASPAPTVTYFSSRMPIWSTIHGTTRRSCARSLRVRLRSFMARAFAAARPRRCSSGTWSATEC